MLLQKEIVFFSNQCYVPCKYDMKGWYINEAYCNYCHTSQNTNQEFLGNAGVESEALSVSYTHLTLPTNREV